MKRVGNMVAMISSYFIILLISLIVDYSEKQVQAFSTSSFYSVNNNYGSVALHPQKPELYFTDNYYIKKMILRRDLNGSYVASDPIVVAGNEAEIDTLQNNVSALNVLLKQPTGLFFDGDSILFAEKNRHVIRKIDSSGIITTLAGVGSAGFSGDGGSALSANLKSPMGVFLTGNGELFIADSLNDRIRKIFTNGTIITVAGTGSTTYNGDGILATNAALSYPIGIVVTPYNEILSTDANMRVRKVDSSSIISTIAGSEKPNQGIGLATKSSLLTTTHIYVSEGDIYFSDYRRVFRIRPSGYLEIISQSTSDIMGFDIDNDKSSLFIITTSGLLLTTNTTSCGGLSEWNINICGGNGTCNNSQCSCFSGYQGDNCQYFTCFNVPSTSSAVCGGRGTCYAFDTCQCINDITAYGGMNCTDPICFGKISTSADACSGRGTCTFPNICNCKGGYYGTTCNITTCFGVFSNSSNVCNGHGICSSFNNCSCIPGYLGDNCGVTSCFGFLSNDTSVCNGYGNCTSNNICSCGSGHYGEDCEFEGYSCFSYGSNDPRVCNYGNGTCTEQDTCKCKNKNRYSGENCQYPVCNGLNSTNYFACNGNGVCAAPNLCICSPGFFGPTCGIDIRLIVGIICASLVPCIGCVVLVGVVYCRYWRKKKKIEKDLETRLLDDPISQTNLKDFPYVIPLHNIEVIKKIGSGGFGQVYKCKWKGTIVAMKVFESDEDNESFLREASLLNTLKHPNIITFFGVSFSDTKRSIIVEYLERGSLERLIYQMSKNQITVPLQKKLKYMLDIAHGMSFLHNLQPKIIHRDLKPGNILLDNGDNCKILDFGTSRYCSASNNNLTRSVGTFFYMPPEMLSDDNSQDSLENATAIDVFSFSILMWQLFFEECGPYSYTNIEKMFFESNYDDSEYKKFNATNYLKKILDGVRPQIPITEENCHRWCEKFIKDNVDPDIMCSVVLSLMEIIKRGWNQDPKERPCFDTLVYQLQDLYCKLGNTDN